MLLHYRQSGRSLLHHLGGIALLAVFALLLVIYSVLAPSLLSSWRLDMTENQQYSLSEGSRIILADLPQDISLKLYFSETASKGLPQIRQYADDVWNILEEMRQQSKGRLKLERIDPEPFSEAEDDAASIGLQAVPLASGEQLYFGLVAGNELDGLQVMPFLQPDKALFLEYDLAKMIAGLASPEPLRVGWLSSLPAVPVNDPLTGQSAPGWEVYRQLEQLYDVLPLPLTANDLPESLDLLIIAAPRDLSLDMAFSIEQYVLGGGRLLLFLDPLAERLPSAADGNTHLTGLESLLKHWGIGFDATQVVGDLEFALQVNLAPDQRPVRHIAILGVRESAMNQEDIVSADLEIINLSTAGHLYPLDNPLLAVFPLLESSENAGLLSMAQVVAVDNPAELARDFVATGERYVLAARYQGLADAILPQPESSTINAADVSIDELRKKAQQKMPDKPRLLSQAIVPIQMIVFTDSDLLDDRFWVQQQAFLQQTVSSAFADNGNLVVNAVDNLLGTEALISIRARHVTQRPFQRVEKMRFAAEQQLREQEQTLQRDLQQIENRLQTMQSPENPGKLTTTEQQAEIQQFMEQRLATRKQLRQVQQSLNQNIRQLGTRLKVLNIIVLPALVAGLSLLFFWWRRRLRMRK